MGGASPRPPMRRPQQGRQRAQRRERRIQGIRSAEPPTPILPIPCMRAPRQPTIGGSSSVPRRESTRSTWNACGGLSGLPSMDDRERVPRDSAAAAVPRTSCKRVRGAARWRPLPVGAKSRRLTARREDLLADSRGTYSSAGRRLVVPVLEHVASPPAVRRGVLTGAHVEAELFAVWVRPQQGEGIRTPRPKRLEIARKAGGGGRSTWNVSGQVWPKPGAAGGGHARAGRIADQRRTMEATADPRMPA